MPPPLPPQGKGHSGEYNSKLLHVKQAEGWPARTVEWKEYLGARPRARERGGGAFRASRASIISSPFSCFPFLSNACHARRLAEGSPFKMWFPIVLQNSLTYKQKFQKHVFSAHPLAALVERKENAVWKGKFQIFFSELSFPLLSAWPCVRTIQCSLYLYKQAYKLSIPFGPVFRKACVHCLDNGFRKHLFSEQWLI